MAVNAFPYLVITDGTDTVTIQDGAGGLTSYALVADTWAPATATRRVSALGGQLSYTDIAEELELTIRGADTATAYDNLQKLTRLLDKADRWSGDENVSPVLIKFAPQGSTVASTSQPL